MEKRHVLHISIFLIVLIILIIFIYCFIAYPGVFLSFKNCETWIDNEIGKKMISEKQVKRILSKIDNMSDKIVYCNVVLERIGTASYMSDNYESYIQETNKTNKYMIENFGNLYDKLKSHIEKRINKKCIYPGLLHSKNHDYPNLAMPGFNIFKGGSILGREWNVVNVHVDLQYEKIIWLYKKIYDSTKTLSFTLAINVPNNSGLYLFEKQYKDFVFIPSISLRNVKKQKEIYEIGNLYLHDGHTYHMISSFVTSKDLYKNDRITLQGHGIYNVTDDEYWLYW